MEIRIQSGDELDRLLDVIAHDIVDANIYYRLLVGLCDAQAEYWAEFAQANSFWSFTLQALEEAYLTRLCRVFDQHVDTLNLYNLLETIKANLHYFEEAHFRERLKDNAFVNSLAKDARIPIIDEIQGDLDIASTRNPVVQKLTIWRHTYHAHRGAKAALGRVPSVASLQFQPEEINSLLDECFRILNRYLHLYKATHWSRQMVGHDDFLSVLRLMRIGREAREAEIR